ncbi:hypothetical protein MKW94_001903 [Papaver nudicaule]|uniref:Bms1-type G domain-containing protein n=1 Tax=Papaver nudicaule TaxID=74823 RepID=A0AA41S672_PAPNU|nr:hypothetical protein [Papaver nudicaule]
MDTKRRKLNYDDENLNEHEQAPYVIVVHGPPKVGKSLLIKSLIKHYTEQNLVHVQGPITIVSGNRRRIQFVECPNNMNGMIDAAKYADAVILLIDANYGFEMETFEFLNLLQVHDMPKVTGVLTYLDELKDEETQTITKQRLMDQFRTDIYEEARIFCLSGFHHEMYQEHEIRELANFLLAMEFQTLSWRATHPYLLVDRFEDVTPPDEVQMDRKCNRNIILYGYLRGCDFKKGTKVHIAGVGDYPLADISISDDPCPLQPVDSDELKVNIKHNNIVEEPQLEIVSFRIGTYLMFGVLGVPFETVTNHDPRQPILVGGISPEEQIIGYMQARLTPHSWYMNSLKSEAPIIVSVGWRRYQTIPIYSRDCNGRCKMLEYTPENESCLATFWGPFAPSGARVVAVRSLADYKAAFRILATAEVLDFNHTANIVKKIKRMGTPCLILNETALIKDMFTSDDEVDRFRDVKVKTERGIRGEVNEAAKPELLSRVHWNDGQPREGIANCTFDCRIHMNDIVLMSEWTQVEVPRIFNPRTTALEPSNCVWETVQMQKKLSEIEEGKAHVLVISEDKKIATESLRKRLIEIYGPKLKDGPVQGRQTLEQRRAVIIIDPVPSGLRSESRVEWLKRMKKSIRKKSCRGLITKIVSREPGLRLDKAVETGIAGGTRKIGVKMVR